LLADVDRAVADPLDRPGDDDHPQSPLAHLRSAHDVHEPLDEAPVRAVDQLVELDEALGTLEVALAEGVHRHAQHLLRALAHLGQDRDERRIRLDVGDQLRQLRDRHASVGAPLEQQVDVDHGESSRMSRATGVAAPGPLDRVLDAEKVAVDLVVERITRPRARDLASSARMPPDGASAALSGAAPDLSAPRPPSDPGYYLACYALATPVTTSSPPRNGGVSTLRGRPYRPREPPRRRKRHMPEKRQTFASHSYLPGAAARRLVVLPPAGGGRSRAWQSFVAPPCAWSSRGSSRVHYSAVGSARVSAITNKQVDFGASDAPFAANPTCGSCVQIPWAPHRRLQCPASAWGAPTTRNDGPVLAKIYRQDHELERLALKKLNPG
jgi:hypothetical protein